MTTKQRIDLQRMVLIGLRMEGAYGRSARMLVNDARAELGLEIDEARMLGELRLLDDQTLVAQITRPLVGTRWIITEAGEQTLAAAGL